MKKVKYIILVAVAGILIFCCYRIVFAPHSYRDVVSREIDNIQPSINTWLYIIYFPRNNIPVRMWCKYNPITAKNQYSCHCD